MKSLCSRLNPKAVSQAQAACHATECNHSAEEGSSLSPNTGRLGSAHGSGSRRESAAGYGQKMARAASGLQVEGCRHAVRCCMLYTALCR
jgi:hypothetical protein